MFTRGTPGIVATPLHIAGFDNLLYTSDWKFNCRDSSQAIFNKLKQVRNIRKSWNRNNLESFLLVAKFQ